MRTPAPPPGSRFFARVDQFHCECPRCGRIVLGRPTVNSRSPAVYQARAHHRQVRSAYNPLTSTLRCPGCHAVYQVGLLLWPVRKGVWGRDERIPADQRPTRDQMRQLRQYATGWYAEELRKKGQETNVFVTAECTCPWGGWATACPIHGWDQATGRFRGEGEGGEEE